MINRTTIQVSDEIRKELKFLASKRDKNYQELLSDMLSVFKELDRDKTIISIPKKLAGRINEIIKNTDFKTVSEYVSFILRILFYENAEPEKINESKLKARLKALGYL